MSIIRLLLCTVGYLLFTCHTGSAQQQVVAGRLVTIDSFPSAFLSAHKVQVWLPPGYDSARRYPVLYMHDGQMLFDKATTWNGQEWRVDDTLGAMISRRKISACIVIAVWNNGSMRHSEYMPQKPAEKLDKADYQRLLQTGQGDYRLFPGGRLQSDAYLRFLVRELKPYVDRRFPTLPDRAHTFIMGSSMGGLISLYALCEYPEVFGGAACLSTHWPGLFTAKDNPYPGAMLTYLQQKLPSPATHRLYFDCGNQTLDSMYGRWQNRADAILRRKGYGQASFVSKRFPGAPHTEEAWADRLNQPLLFLLGKPGKPMR